MVVSACQSAPSGGKPKPKSCELPSSLGDVGTASKTPAAFRKLGDDIKLTVSSPRAGVAGALAVSLNVAEARLEGRHDLSKSDARATLLSQPLSDGDLTRYHATRGVVSVASDGDKLLVTLSDATFVGDDGCTTRVEQARFEAARGKIQPPSVAAKP